MKLSEFHIGVEFEICTGQRWRCTDVGQRSIAAIELKPELGSEWFQGPPYIVPEVLFDEHDIRGAFVNHEQAITDAIAAAESSTHPGYPADVVIAMFNEKFAAASRKYPHPRLFRIDRFDERGQLLHPYSAASSKDGWNILVYAPFTETFNSVSEEEFVRMRPAEPADTAQ